jgi:signal transduction histidine kinase/CheY-like chemotaxis protein
VSSGNIKPPADTPRDASSLRRWVTIAGIALIVLIVAADSYEAWQDYRRVITDNEHMQLALSRAVTEQTARMVQEVDIALSSNPGWPLDTRDGSNDRRMGQLLARIMRLRFVYSASIADREGQVLASSNAAEIGETTLKGQDVFSVPQQSTDKTLFVDQLQPESASGAATFALSQRIESSDGVFAGVVVARVSFAYLASLYAQVTVTPDTSIVLTRADGQILSQYPSIPSTDRRQTQRFSVSQRVEGYPLLVKVSRLRSDVLQPWIQEERSSFARTLSLAALATLLLLALRSALNRQEKVDREKHRLEQELAAVQRVEALGFLAASVAHDFNNVLTAIIGYAELMRETLGSESASATNIERLLAAGERARLLVRRVLTFDPRRSLSYRPTQIEPIIMEAVEQARATLPRSIELEIDGMNQSTTIQGDAIEIFQVVMNLLSNAVHAMPYGGTLRIHLQSSTLDDDRPLALGQLRPGCWVSVAVIDTGIGMAAEQTTSIFEPFYTTRQPGVGTGIGLTVVRNIILRMNGALDVSSRPGEGTRMTVYWPAADTPSASPILVPAANDGAGEAIMVIDDEKELVALTEELLASLSYEPVGFSDARAALEAFRHHPNRFDAILTDERMQPMRGLEFAAWIRAIDADIPIILMTGHRDAQLDARARDLGVSEILDKPLRVQTLRDALGRRLGR